MNARTTPRAFSLIEMLAVLTILAILLALGVPAVRSMIASSERSLAENQLRVGMTAARDAAVRSGGADAAAVFFFQEGRTVILPCVRVGQMVDRVYQGDTDSTTNVTREVFVPVEGVEPIRMPAGWNVRGYATPGLIATGNGAADNPTGWCDCTGSIPLSIADNANWVFPETHFVDMSGGPGLNGGADAEDEGWKQQTFMVRFEGGTGHASLTSRAPVIVVNPVSVMSDDGFRSQAPHDAPEADPTQAASLEVFVRQQLGNPLLLQGDPPDLCKVIGDISPDTVLAMPLTEIALYDEARMASAIGAARLNRVTQSLYADATEPTIDLSLFAGLDEEEVQTLINSYFSRDLVDVPMEARVFTVLRYMGQLQEVGQEGES